MNKERLSLKGNLSFFLFCFRIVKFEIVHNAFEISVVVLYDYYQFSFVIRQMGSYRSKSLKISI